MIMSTLRSVSETAGELSKRIVYTRIKARIRLFISIENINTSVRKVESRFKYEKIREGKRVVEATGSDCV